MSTYSDLVQSRAIEVLERTEPDPAELAEHAARARRNRKLDAIEKWDPANPKGLTPGRMSQSEYDSWHAAGCPPLETGSPLYRPLWKNARARPLAASITCWTRRARSWQS